ncbi:MAG: FYDLN acid domain-containing protein [Rhodoblastus sp.]
MNDQRGVKRLCATCGTRFFDLMAKPVCPKCHTEIYIPPPAPPRRPPKPLTRRFEPAPVAANSAEDVPENDDDSPITPAEEGDEDQADETETVEQAL